MILILKRASLRARRHELFAQKLTTTLVSLSQGLKLVICLRVPVIETQLKKVFVPFFKIYNVALFWLSIAQLLIEPTCFSDKSSGTSLLTISITFGGSNFFIAKKWAKTQKPVTSVFSTTA